MARLGLLIGSVTGVLVLAAVTAWLLLSYRAQNALAVPSIGGAFELTDQDARSVTERDLLGKPSAIFFGFTNCPDICPTTLLEITNWLKALGGDADKLNVAFVSVDSERDTPQQLKLYLSSFDPRIRGLTGSEAQIQKITSAYRVYYKRVTLDGGGYTYDHSAIIYLMDASGRHVGILSYQEPDEVALDKLQRLIRNNR
jgi:protein SCO1/2